MDYIGAGDEPMTLDEVREAVDLLIKKFSEDGTVELGLLGFVRGMLRHTMCTCGPVDTGHQAVVRPLRVRNSGPDTSTKR